MKHLTLVFLLFINYPSFAQIEYSKGYFIDNDSQKVECFIRNVEWKNNPRKFQYKLSETGEATIAHISNVAEFVIYNQVRYIRAKVKLDTSSKDINDLSSALDPEFSTEVLFLKVLVEGIASLYVYEDKRFRRYFFRVKNLPINQLIYKEYYITATQVGRNASFQYQLSSNLKCGNLTTLNLRYNQKELEKYFNLYNACMGGPVQEKEKKRRDVFNLRLLGGLNYNFFTLRNLYDNYYTTRFDPNINLRGGIQLEAIFPFNRNKWSVFFEGNYNYYNSTGEGDALRVKTNFKYVEFPIGIRHYFFLSQQNKLFLNVQYNLNYMLRFDNWLLITDKSTGTNNFLETYPNPSFLIGGGAEFGRISAEVRYATRLNFMQDFWDWRTDYKRVSLIIGWKVF